MKTTYLLEDAPLPKFFGRKYSTPKAFPPINPLLKSPEMRTITAIGLALGSRRREGVDAEQWQDFAFDDGGGLIDVSKFEPWMLQLAAAVATVLSKEPPLYCLDVGLFGDFENTEPPAFQSPPFSFAMWVPEFECSASDCGDSHQVLFLVHHVGNDLLIANVSFNNRDYTVVSGSCEVCRLDRKPDRWGLNLVSNTIAYMTSYSEAVEITDSSVKSFRGNGFANPSTPVKMLRPRMISQTQRKRIVRKSPTSGQQFHDRASPVTHWRRGHWHKYKVGQGRKEEKLNWIEPVLVNSGGDQ
ncbi:hypothetical protein D0962_18845 [Leptolyngbyaceae cyanobacterium CCMR0082]|uniref:Uncharacterized protein n=1 Tax=Adonisia turfae CCMR0082 TaxID=2304604 RepID=A0A6M0S8S5_9CYAN|nr:hypothetical protein [Adonisia turfae]NEZ64819.1 hypothetical protein [Adonisia turfae CCMR0082]